MSNGVIAKLFQVQTQELHAAEGIGPIVKKRWTKCEGPPKRSWIRKGRPPKRNSRRCDARGHEGLAKAGPGRVTCATIGRTVTLPMQPRCACKNGPRRGYGTGLKSDIAACPLCATRAEAGFKCSVGCTQNYYGPFDFGGSARLCRCYRRLLTTD